MEPNQQQCWSRESTTERVNVPALVAILDVVTNPTPPHVLVIALTRPLLLPASRAATIAKHLTANAAHWTNDLSELNGTAPTSPANGAEFISQCARWLRDAARTNEPVHCLPGVGPFEIAPKPETVPTIDEPTDTLHQDPADQPDQLSLAGFVKDFDPALEVWVHRLLTEQFMNATVARSTASAADRQALIEAAPDLTGTKWFDVYLAAIAHHIANQSGLAAPAWTNDPARNRLADHYYPSGEGHPRKLEALRADTPPAFAARNIYIANPNIPDLSTSTRQPLTNEDYR